MQEQNGLPTPVAESAVPPFIRFIRVFLLVLIITGIGLLCTQNMWVPKVVDLLLGTDAQEAAGDLGIDTLSRFIDGDTPPGYTGFASSTVLDIPKGQASAELVPDVPSNLAFTLFNRDDQGGARLRIRNLATGAQCDTQSYLIDKVYVSDDATTALVFTFSGVDHYLDAVDTATCMPIAPTVTAVDASQPLSCPAQADAAAPKTLSSISVYDGFPSEMADLVPENGGWRNIGGEGASKEGYYLVCRYGDYTASAGYEKSIGYAIPQSFTDCVLADEGIQVTCS